MAEVKTALRARGIIYINYISPSLFGLQIKALESYQAKDSNHLQPYEDHQRHKDVF